MPTDFSRAARFARQTIEQVLQAGLRAGQVATINIPALRSDEHPTGVRVCRQCTRPWVDTYAERKSPRGQSYFWNNSVFSLGMTDDDTDVAGVRDGYITVTPLQFDLTHHIMMREWKGREWKLSS